MPISHALLENRQQYYKSLLRYQRFAGDEDDPRRSNDIEDMALLMADCGHRAAEQTREAASAVEFVMGEWNKKPAGARQKSAVWHVAEELIRTPVFTIEVMQEQTGLPLQTVYRCVRELTARGILTTNGSRRNTIYTADHILRIAGNVLRIRARAPESPAFTKRAHSSRGGSRAVSGQQSRQERSRPKRAPSGQQHSGIAARCDHEGPRSGKRCARRRPSRTAPIPVAPKLISRHQTSGSSTNKAATRPVVGPARGAAYRL